MKTYIFKYSGISCEMIWTVMAKNEKEARELFVADKLRAAYVAYIEITEVKQGVTLIIDFDEPNYEG